MNDGTSHFFQGRHLPDGEQVRKEAVTGGVAAPVVLRMVPSPGQKLEQRLRYLMDVLVAAQDELAGALLDDFDAVVAAACARRLSSVGWLMREAADKHDRSVEA